MVNRKIIRYSPSPHWTHVEIGAVAASAQIESCWLPKCPHGTDLEDLKLVMTI